MSRVSWMNIASLATVGVCLLLAYLVTFAQWTRLQEARRENDQVNQQVGLMTAERDRVRQSYKPISGILTRPESKIEEYQFLTEIQQLMRTAGVRQEKIDQARPTPLPTLDTQGAARTDRPPTSKPDEKKAEPSLLNLPMGVRAASTNLVVQGRFPDIHRFLYQIQNYRYAVRTINVNSLVMDAADERGTVRATMTLTRFIQAGGSAEKAPPLESAPDGAKDGLRSSRL
jgi:hypothetical protein